jgi:hypothetical protein
MDEAMKKPPKLFYTRYADFAWYQKKMRLGSDYMVRMSGNWHLCRFIKVTPKGFNLLDLKTNKCIKKDHLYTKKWRGKVIPKDVVWFKVNVPEWIMIGANVSREEEDIG